MGFILDVGGIPTLESLLDNVTVDESTQCWVWMPAIQKPTNNGKISPIRWEDTSRSVPKALFGLYYSFFLADEDKTFPIGYCKEHGFNELCVSPHHRAVKTVFCDEEVFILGSSDAQFTAGFALQSIKDNHCKNGHPYTANSWRPSLIRSHPVETKKTSKTFPAAVFIGRLQHLKIYRMQRKCHVCRQEVRLRERADVRLTDQEIVDWSAEANEYIRGM